MISTRKSFDPVMDGVKQRAGQEHLTMMQKSPKSYAANFYDLRAREM